MSGYTEGSATESPSTQVSSEHPYLQLAGICLVLGFSERVWGGEGAGRVTPGNVIIVVYRWL